MTEHSANGPGRPKDLTKRQAILDAARALFLTHGYASTSMDAVASEAGVSKLTVYSHFTDKETLFSAAVIATCEAQLPEVLFELPTPLDVHSVLMNIGRGLHGLISSPESVNLHRLIMGTGSQDAALCQIFFEAGPQRILNEMECLFRQLDSAGALCIADPANAAEHFCSLLKGAGNFRALMGTAEPLSPAEAERHVAEVVRIFVRAFAC